MLLLKFFAYAKWHSAHSKHIDSKNYVSSSCLQEVKNSGESLNFQPLKVVVVAYRRWSFNRGSNCKAWVFWIGCRLWGLVVYERRSHMEVELKGGNPCNKSSSPHNELAL